MKRRLFLPLHLFILFATLLAAGYWCPRADAHEPEKGAFRHAPTQYETVIQDVYQPLLIQTARPARPRARTFPKGQRRPGVRRRTKRRSPHAPAAPVRRASGGGPPPSPSLLAGPCRIPSASSRDDRLTAFPHMTPSGNRAKDTPTLGPCRARAAKRTESSVLPASGHPETRARRTCSPKTGEVSPFVPAPAGGNHGSSQEAVV